MTNAFSEPTGDPFEVFLADSIAKEQEKDEQAIEILALDTFFEAEMERQKLPRLISGAGEEIPYETTMRTIQYRNAFRIQMQDERETFESDEAFEDEIKEYARMAILGDFTTQSKLLARAKLITMTFRFYAKHNPEYDGTEHHEKKKFIAEILVIDGLNPTDPWVVFLNETVPGPRLDPDSAADEPFILAAIEEQSRIVARNEQIHGMQADMWDIMGIDTDPAEGVHTIQQLDDMQRLLPIASTILSAAMLAEDPIERSAAIDKAIREAPITAEIAAKLKSYLQAKFPTA